MTGLLVAAVAVTVGINVPCLRCKSGRGVMREEERGKERGLDRADVEAQDGAGGKEEGGRGRV